MDFTFRCNSTECRAPLQDVAVVTTCTHIFCRSCSDALGLSKHPASDRYCPACDARLENARDAVLNNLKPTEDYKSSILSGLTPSMIMECAGRALHFYAYQVSQEIVYQEYIGKTIADKYSTLSSHLDKIITDANSEVMKLRTKISSFEQDRKALHSKVTALRSDYDNKCRALQKLQKEHDALKGRLSISDSKTAAANAVERSMSLQGNRHHDGQVGMPISLHDTIVGDNAAQYQEPVDSVHLDWNAGVETLYRKSSSSTPMRHSRSMGSHASTHPPVAQDAPFRNPSTRNFRASMLSIPGSLQHGW